MPVGILTIPCIFCTPLWTPAKYVLIKNLGLRWLGEDGYPERQVIEGLGEVMFRIHKLISDLQLCPSWGHIPGDIFSTELLIQNIHSIYCIKYTHPENTDMKTRLLMGYQWENDRFSFLVIFFLNCLFISKTKNFKETFPVLSFCNLMNIMNCLIPQAHKNSPVMLCFIFTYYIYTWYSIVCGI